MLDPASPNRGYVAKLVRVPHRTMHCYYSVAAIAPSCCIAILPLLHVLLDLAHMLMQASPVEKEELFDHIAHMVPYGKFEADMPPCTGRGWLHGGTLVRAGAPADRPCWGK